MLHDLTKYKLAKIVKKDLPVALNKVQTSIKILSPYRRYKSIANCLRVLSEELENIKLHINAYAAIEKKKENKNEGS